MRKQGYVYILASGRNGTIYVGVTSNLEKRMFVHKEGLLKKSFTRYYNVDKLVYFEQYENIRDAISREKQLKNWKRSWKIDLIEKENKEWKDLYENYF
ncbi:MAG: GIY-YIG nuclease family protein [candidate division WWE3 bacterium]|nr:GIY-YIG nuclease family protein [candidate division WWE3 bacterium]